MVEDLVCDKARTETQVCLIQFCSHTLEELGYREEVRLGVFQTLNEDFIQFVGKSTSI